MLEKLISKILAHYLSDYIEAIDPKMFEISAMKGEVSLSNLNVKSTALDSVHPSITIQKGTVCKLNATVPWRHIKSRPSKVAVSGIYVLASFKTTKSIKSAFTEEKERKQLVEKWNIIDAWEEGQSDYIKGKKSARELDDEELIKTLNEVKKADENEGEEEEEEDEEASIVKDGFGLKFVKNLVRNLTVTITDMHVRLELVKPTPLAIGVAFESLELISVNPIPKGKKEAKKMVFVPVVKQLTIKNLCVYVNPAFQSYYDMSSETMAEQFSTGIPRGTSVPPHCYILKPVTITAVVNMNPQGLTKKGLPKFSFDLDIPVLPIRLISSQLSAFFTQPVNWVTFGMSPVPLYHRRPDRPPSYTRAHRHHPSSDTNIEQPRESSGLYAQKWWRHILMGTREQLWLKKPLVSCSTSCNILPELNDKPTTMILTIYALMHMREKHGWGWIIDKSGICQCDLTGCYSNSVSKIVSDGKGKSIFDYASFNKSDRKSIGCRYCGGRTRLLAMEGRGGMSADMIRIGRQAAHDYITKRGYNPGNFSPGTKEFVKQMKKYKIPDPKLPPRTDMNSIPEDNFVGGWVGVTVEELRRLVYCVETIQKRQQLLADLKKARDKDKDSVTSFVQAKLYFGGINMELCLSKEDISNVPGHNKSSPFLGLRQENIFAERYQSSKPVNGPDVTPIIPFARMWLRNCRGHLDMKSDDSMNVNLSIHDLGARNYCCDNATNQLENNKHFPVFLRKMPSDPKTILTFITERYEFKDTEVYNSSVRTEAMGDGTKPLIGVKLTMPGKNTMVKELSHSADSADNSNIMADGKTTEYITMISAMNVYLDMQPLQFTFSEKFIITFLTGLEIFVGIKKRAKAMRDYRKEQLYKDAGEEYSDASEVSGPCDSQDSSVTDVCSSADKPWDTYEKIGNKELRDIAISNFKSFPTINVKGSAPVFILPVPSSLKGTNKSQLLYLNCGNFEVKVEPMRPTKEIELRNFDGSLTKKNIYLDPEDVALTPDVSEHIKLGVRAILKGTSIYNPKDKDDLVECILLKQADRKTTFVDEISHGETEDYTDTENPSAECIDSNLDSHKNALFSPFCVEVLGSVSMIGDKIGYKKADMKIGMKGWDSRNALIDDNLPVVLEVDSEKIFDLLTDLKFMFDRILAKSMTSVSVPSDTTSAIAPISLPSSNTSTVPLIQKDTCSDNQQLDNEQNSKMEISVKSKVPQFAIDQKVMSLDVSCNSIMIVFNMGGDMAMHTKEKCEIVIGKMRASVDMNLLDTKVKAKLGETSVRYVEDNYFIDLFKLEALKNTADWGENDGTCSAIAEVSVLNSFHPLFEEEGMEVGFEVGSLAVDLNIEVIMKFVNVLMGFSSLATSASMSLTDITTNVVNITQRDDEQSSQTDSDLENQEQLGVVCPSFVYTGKYNENTVLEFIANHSLAKQEHKTNQFTQPKSKMLITGSVAQMKAIMKDNYSHDEPVVSPKEFEELRSIPFTNYIVAFIKRTDVKVCSDPENDIMDVSVLANDIGMKEKTVDTKRTNDILWTCSGGVQSNNSGKQDVKDQSKPFLALKILSIPKTSPAFHGIPLYVFVNAKNKKMFMQFRPSLFVTLTNSGLLNFGSDNEKDETGEKEDKDKEQSTLGMDLVKLQRKLDLKLPSVHRDDVPSLSEMCQDKIDSMKEQNAVPMLLSVELDEIQLGMRVSDGELSLGDAAAASGTKGYDFFVFSIKNVQVNSSFPMLANDETIIRRCTIPMNGEEITGEELEDIRISSEVYSSGSNGYDKLMLSRYKVSIESMEMKYMVGILNKDESDKYGDDPNYNVLYGNAVEATVLYPISVSVDVMMPLLYNNTIKAVARGQLSRMYLDVELWRGFQNGITPQTQNKQQPISLSVTPTIVQALFEMLSSPTEGVRADSEERTMTRKSVGTMGFVMSYKPKSVKKIDISIQRQQFDLPALVSEIIQDENGAKMVDKTKNLPYVIRQYCRRAATNHSDLPDSMVKGVAMGLTFTTPGVELLVLKTGGDDFGCSSPVASREDVLKSLINSCQTSTKLASFVMRNIFVKMTISFAGFDTLKLVIDPNANSSDRSPLMEMLFILGSITADIRSTSGVHKNTVKSSLINQTKIRALRANNKFGLGLSGVGRDCVAKSNNTEANKEAIGTELYKIFETSEFYEALESMEHKRFISSATERSSSIRGIRSMLEPKSFITVVFKSDNHNFNDVAVNVGVLNVTARPNLLYQFIDFVFGIKFPSFATTNNNNNANSQSPRQQDNGQVKAAQNLGSAVASVLQSKKQTGLLISVNIESVSLDLITRCESKDQMLSCYNVLAVRLPAINVACSTYTLLNETTDVLVPILENCGVTMTMPVISYWRLEQMLELPKSGSTSPFVLFDKKPFKKFDRRYFLWVNKSAHERKQRTSVSNVNELFSVLIRAATDIDPNSDTPNNLVVIVSLPSSISLNLSVGDAEFVSYAANEILSVCDYVSHKMELGKADEVVEFQDGESRTFAAPDAMSSSSGHSLSSQQLMPSTSDIAATTEQVKSLASGDPLRAANSSDLIKKIKKPNNDHSMIAKMCKASRCPYIATKVSLDTESPCSFSVVIEDSSCRFSPVLCAKASLSKLHCDGSVITIPGQFNHMEMNADLELTLHLNQFNPRVLTYEPLVALPKMRISAQVLRTQGTIQGINCEQPEPISRICANMQFPSHGVNICVVPETMFIVQKMTQIVTEAAENFANITGAKRDTEPEKENEEAASSAGSSMSTSAVSSVLSSSSASKLAKYNTSLKWLGGSKSSKGQDERVNTQLPRMSINNYLSSDIRICFFDPADVENQFDHLLKNQSSSAWKKVKAFSYNSSSKTINLPDSIMNHVTSAHVMCSFQISGRRVVVLAPLNREYSVTKLIEFSSPNKKSKDAGKTEMALLNIDLSFDHNQHLRYLSFGSPLVVRNDSTNTIKCRIVDKTSVYRDVAKRQEKSDNLWAKELETNDNEIKKLIAKRCDKLGAADITSFVVSERDSFITTNHKTVETLGPKLGTLFTLAPKDESFIPVEYFTNLGSNFLLFFSEVSSSGKESRVSTVGLATLVHDNLIPEVIAKHSPEQENRVFKDIADLFPSANTQSKDKKVKKSRKDKGKQEQPDGYEDDEQEIDTNLDNMRSVKVIWLNDDKEPHVLLSKSGSVTDVTKCNVINDSSCICGFFSMGKSNERHYKFCYERTFKSITKLHILDAVKIVNNHSFPLYVSPSAVDEKKVKDVTKDRRKLIEPHRCIFATKLAPTNASRETSLGIWVGGDKAIKASATINIACLQSLAVKPPKDRKKELKKKESKEKKENKLNKADKNNGLVFSSTLKLCAAIMEKDVGWDGSTCVVISALAPLVPLTIAFGPPAILHNNVFGCESISVLSSTTGSQFSLPRGARLELGGIGGNEKSKILTLTAAGEPVEFGPLSDCSQAGTELAPSRLGDMFVLLRKTRRFSNNSLGVGTNLGGKNIVKPGSCLHMELFPSRAIVNRTDKIIGILTFKSIESVSLKALKAPGSINSNKDLNNVIVETVDKSSWFYVVQPRSHIMLDPSKDNIAFATILKSKKQLATQKPTKELVSGLKFSGSINLDVPEQEVNKRDVQMMLVDRNPTKKHSLMPFNALFSLRTFSLVNILTITQVENDEPNNTSGKLKQDTQGTKQQQERKTKQQIETRHVAKYVVQNNLVWEEKEKLKKRFDSLVVLQCLNAKHFQLTEAEKGKEPVVGTMEIKAPLFAADMKSVRSDFIIHQLGPGQMVGLFGCCDVEMKDKRSNIVLLVGVGRCSRKGTVKPRKCVRWYQVNMGEKSELNIKFNETTGIDIECSSKDGRRCLIFNCNKARRLRKGTKENMFKLSNSKQPTIQEPPMQLSVSVVIPRVTVNVFDSYPMPAVSVHLHELLVHIDLNSIINTKDGTPLRVCGTTQQLMTVSAAMNLIQVQLDNKNIRNAKGKIIKDTFCKFPVVLTRDCRVSRDTPMLMFKMIMKFEAGDNASALLYIPLIEAQLSPLVISCDDGIVKTAIKLLYDYKILGVERDDLYTGERIVPINGMLTSSLADEQEDKQAGMNFVCIEKMKIGCVSALAFLSLPKILRALASVEVNNAGQVQTISIIPPTVMRLIHVLMPSTGMGSGTSILRSKIEDEGIKVACYKTELRKASCSTGAIGMVIGNVYKNQIGNIVGDLIGSNFNTINIDFSSLVGKTKWEWYPIEKFFASIRMKTIPITFDTFISSFFRHYKKDSSFFTAQLYDDKGRDDTVIKVDLRSLNPLNTFKQLNVFKALETKLEPDRLRCLRSYHINRKDRSIACIE